MTSLGHLFLQLCKELILANRMHLYLAILIFLLQTELLHVLPDDVDVLLNILLEVRVVEWLETLHQLL